MSLPERKTKPMAAKNYVLAGTGGRGVNMFAKPLVGDEFDGKARLVGLFDRNASRMRAANEMLGTDLPTYTDYRSMLQDLDPDGVIIATQDSAHCQFLVETLQAGKRAICEKPLCTTAEQCRRIAAAAAKSDAQGLVTHNARYGAASTAIKQILTSGRLGRILTMEYHEMLDRRHGADYFRRWHRRKANSGGLLIHKASHHFDLLNWFADSLPDKLVAVGDLAFYGKNNAFRHTRCRECPHAEKCGLHVDMFANERSRKLYLETEADDGYLRDACLWDDQIDIEDRASVIYNYQNGIHVTYTLQAFASYEGERIIIEGTAGRLELSAAKDTRWAAGDVTVHGMEELVGERLRVFQPGKSIEDVELKRAQGSHGGSDPLLRHEFFARDAGQPPTDRMASLDQAIQAVLIGAAANQSIATGQMVDVQQLLK
jgi:predicted dehydrogenase